MNTKRRKKYRLRDDSPIYTIGTILAAAAIVAIIGLMNSWELGLL